MKKNVNHIRYSKMYLLVILLFLASCDKENIESPLPYSEGTVRIAK